MKAIFGFVVLVVLLALAWIYGGFYDIGASSGHNAFERWLFHTSMEHAVERRAADVEVPQQLPMAMTGLRAYHEMCVTCHGGPGLEPSPIGKGLTPDAPELSEAGREFSSAELFWILKHGIKFTGMPAWGATHKDEELWQLVAFVEHLPYISPEQYQQMVEGLEGQGGHGH